MSHNEFYVYGEQNVQVPAHLHFGKYLLDRLLQNNDNIAMENADTGEKITYKEFAQYAVNLATKLKELGVQRGDVVAVGSEKRNEFGPTFLGILLSGAAYTPYELQSGRSVLQFKLSVAKPSYFICSKLFWESYSDILLSCKYIKKFISFDDGPESAILMNTLIRSDTDVGTFEPVDVKGQIDTAVILYSSGTTGMPKGVSLTHLNCILSSLPKEFSDESLQTVFIFGEWYHNYDTFMAYKFLSLGRKIVYPKVVTIESILACVEKYQVNIAMLIPVLINLLAKDETIEKYNLDSLKIIYTRSAPIHSKIITEIKKRFPKLKNVMQGYGMTERGEVTSEAWGTKGLKNGSVGMAAPGIVIKVVHLQTNKTLGPNEEGEIRIKGAGLMKGYIGTDPSEYLDEEGFLKTGDLGFYDSDKYFYVVDRIKEIISYGGYKVLPLELETILQSHPDIQEAGVVGKLAADGLELPTAFVVRQPDSNITEQEIVDYVAVEVPPYMQLRGGVIFTSKLPRNYRGKLLRRELRDLVHHKNCD